ncbi:hypothetical protein ACVWZZ_000560 [Bradyrhizobium sp. LM6.10]
MRKISSAMMLVALLACGSTGTAWGQGGGGGGSSGGSGGGGSASSTSGVGIGGALGGGTSATTSQTGSLPSDRGNAGDASRGTAASGTNAAGTAQSSGGPQGSTTVGRPGNLAGGTSSGRIDGTATPGPSMQGDAEIRSENSQGSTVDRKIKSICKGC